MQCIFSLRAEHFQDLSSVPPLAEGPVVPPQGFGQVLPLRSALLLRGRVLPGQVSKTEIADILVSMAFPHKKASSFKGEKEKIISSLPTINGTDHALRLPKQPPPAIFVNPNFSLPSSQLRFLFFSSRGELSTTAREDCQVFLDVECKAKVWVDRGEEKEGKDGGGEEGHETVSKTRYGGKKKEGGRRVEEKEKALSSSPSRSLITPPLNTRSKKASSQHRDDAEEGRKKALPSDSSVPKGHFDMYQGRKKRESSSSSARAPIAFSCATVLPYTYVHIWELKKLLAF